MEAERDKILKEFTVDKDGIIRTLGKFEGEMLYAPYFYEIVMNGFGDQYYLPQEDRVYSVFPVGDEDKAEFPELEDGIGVICFETDQGFFIVESYTVGQETQFNLAVSELAELAGEEVDEEVANPLTMPEERILAVLSEDEPMEIEEIAGLAGLPMSHTASHLMVLDIRRLVKQLPGRRFIKEKQ